MKPANFDIAIIGGGVIGLTLARALCGKHARVVVVDAAGEIPAATNAAAGMLAPSFEVGEGSEALTGFGEQSLSMWPAFAAAIEEETGIDVDFRPGGILGVAYEETGARALQQQAEALEARGAPASYLSGDEVRRLEPLLCERVVAGMHAVNDAQVDPRKLLLALRASVSSIAQIINGRVLRTEPKGSAHTVTLASGEQLEAQTLVMASGAAAMNQVVAGLAPLPVFPVKGEAVALAMPEGAFSHVVRAPGAYICPKAGGRLVIGATQYQDRDDYEVDEDAIASLIRNAAAAAPAIADYMKIESWAGLRPGTPDGAPILGRDQHGQGNLFLALGHYRNGVLLAPASAEALAEEILQSAVRTDLKPFRPERFAQ